MKQLHRKSFELFLEQISQSNHIRLFIIAALSLFAFLSYRGTPYLNLALTLILLTLGALAGFIFAYRRIGALHGELYRAYKFLQWVAFAQVALDLLLITAGICLSGGILSPLPILYILYLGAVSVFFFS